MFCFWDNFLRWRRVQKVSKYLPLNSIVCDIGCGKEAYFLKKFSPLIKKGIGLDEEIEDYNDPNLEFKKFKTTDSLPLENESCEVITMMAVIEHLSYPQEILKECFRCLKQGGKIIITTPTPISKPILELSAFKLNLIDKKEISDHKNYFWPERLKLMLVSAGFKEENIKSRFFELLLNSLTIAKK